MCYVCPVCVLSDLEWKIIYVGSAESEEYDQVLDSVLVGPVPAGRHMFVFQVSRLSSYITCRPVSKYISDSKSIWFPGCGFLVLCCSNSPIPFIYFDAISFSLCCCPPPQADAPNTGLIPESDAVGVTVVLITCTYRGQEFIRIGYYVNNEYTDPELRENPPLKPDYTQVTQTQTHTLKGDLFLSCIEV